MENPKVKSLDYDFFGKGNGGTTVTYGAESVLIASFVKDRAHTNKKDDMLSYAAVEIDTK